MTAKHFDCAGAREAIHASLDAELMDAGLQQRLENHLGDCASCREFAAEMRRIQGGLRSLPELKLPDEVLEQVWARTRRARRTRPWYYAAAAAAIVVTVLGGIWLQKNGADPQPTEAELRQAALEARLVLGLTSRALRTGGQKAVDRVLTGEVSEALQKVPIRWPKENAERSGS